MSVDNEKHVVRLFRNGIQVFEGELPNRGGGLRPHYLVIDAKVAATTGSRSFRKTATGAARSAV